MSDVVGSIRRAVADELSAVESSLLAVSGGIDSMVLLDAAIAVSPPGLRVATFDHATGPHTAAGVDLVEGVSLGAGLSLIVGKGEPVDRPSEAGWREARLAFLRAAAAEYGAVLFTAHTRDDQVETVLFRELRGAGTRGLAGLRAAGNARRPLLGFGRADVEQYARSVGVRWVEDPTNASRSHARNRLRHDLLPALRARSPHLEPALLAIGERASQWRAEVDAAVDAMIDFTADRNTRTLDVSAASLAPYDAEVLAVIWPALLARIGVAADWRGTRRLAAFTKEGSTSQRIQLSGGWVVVRRRNGFEVRRHDGNIGPARSTQGKLHGETALPFRGERHRTV
jgi:tRNA(Ile)-lysidine synthase